ncbi:MAG: AAA domain-containing protein [Balneolaceae bacterium]|nr:AAA domain-containing protein [Balneolaceae bacterium]
MADTPHTSFDPQGLVTRSIKALESEIDTLRAYPAMVEWRDGARVGAGEFKFRSMHPSLRFAESIRGLIPGQEEEDEVEVVSMEQGETVLRFTHFDRPLLSNVRLEWENEFVPRKTREEMAVLAKKEEWLERTAVLGLPQDSDVDHEPSEAASTPPVTDPMLNDAQNAAIQAALTKPCIYLWGPPGTGKTATLGHIVSSSLAQGDRVLLVSNTNRAVDVVLKSACNALERNQVTIQPSRMTRFGDPVLEDDQIQELAFSQQLEQVQAQRRDQVSAEIQLLERATKAKEALDRVAKGKKPSSTVQLEWELVQEALKPYGGLDELEELIDESVYTRERTEFRRKSLVATTLAKVSTSDLFRQHEFDVLVVDEASMAQLPQLIVAASHAQKRVVVAGDPMQLPPISVAEDPKARAFMELDIFSLVSGAKESSELFDWHDQRRDATFFFDQQYRMKDRLAKVISSVFYDGRLRTESSAGRADGERAGAGRAGAGRAENDRAESPPATVLNTESKDPYVIQEKGERGFRPMNPIHSDAVSKTILKILEKGWTQHDIGVIVPFRHVANQLMRRWTQEGLSDLEVGTIHTFQGREKPIIIFDTVMSGDRSSAKGERHYTVRPLDETKNENPLHVQRLLNVACSRAKEELLIFADMRHIRKLYHDKTLGKLITRLSQVEEM